MAMHRSTYYTVLPKNIIGIASAQQANLILSARAKNIHLMPYLLCFGVGLPCDSVAVMWLWLCNIIL